MTNAGEPNLTAALDQLIEKRHLLKHPFYRAWTAGRLSRQSLKLYAAQYYWHVKAFPEHLARLSGRADGSLRAIVLENLAEELNPARPHPQLWRNFAAAVGVDDSAFGSAPAQPALQALVDTYHELSEQGSLTEAVAALYAYESQVPEIATQKMEGLRRFYGVSDPRALAYFAVHQEADVRHRAAWRTWLGQQDVADQAPVLQAAERGLKALWGALDAVFPDGSLAN